MSFNNYLSSDFGSTFSGVLTDEHGRVQAIWGSFSTQVSPVFFCTRFYVECSMIVWITYAAEVRMQLVRRSSVCTRYPYIHNQPSPWQNYFWVKWTSSSNKWSQKANARSQNFGSWTLSNTALEGQKFWTERWMGAGIFIVGQSFIFLSTLNMLLTFIFKLTFRILWLRF